jgi:hypothetical protein
VGYNNNKVGIATNSQKLASREDTYYLNFNNLSNKPQTLEFTYTASSATNTIPIGMTINPLKDKISIIWEGLPLTLENYELKTNNYEILLTDWTCDSGDKFYFTVYKNMK